MGTIFTCVACCYKNDICISVSTIVTQNTLKCAISRAKFHFFLSKEGHSPSPDPTTVGRGTPLPTSSSDLMHLPPVSRNPGSTTASVSLRFVSRLRTGIFCPILHRSRLSPLASGVVHRKV